MSDNPFAEPDERTAPSSGRCPAVARGRAPVLPWTRRLAPRHPLRHSRPSRQGADLETTSAAHSPSAWHSGRAAAASARAAAQYGHSPPTPAICATEQPRRCVNSSGGRGRPACRMEQVRPAHYALCAALDDVVLNTPWGARRGLARCTARACAAPRRQRRARLFSAASNVARSVAGIASGHRGDVRLPVSRHDGTVS